MKSLLVLSCTIALATLVGFPQPRVALPISKNNLGMTFVTLPAGVFRQGSPETPQEISKVFGQPERFIRGEMPQHIVKISKPYDIAIHEVTVGQFRAFIKATGYKTDAERNGMGGVHLLARKPEYIWSSPGFVQTEDHPVTQVSWNDADAFCRWLSKKENRTYRLPTEAEWEYACRAGTTTRFYFGDDPEQMVNYANVTDARFAAEFPERRATCIRGNDGFLFTAPVGKFKANSFGLHDMHGNIAEWCADRYAPDAYTAQTETDPTGPPSGHTRVIRGGSFGAGPVHARSATRSGVVPDAAIDVLGFRIVRNKE